jgi:hypothetical protein
MISGDPEACVKSRKGAFVPVTEKPALRRFAPCPAQARPGYAWAYAQQGLMALRAKNKEFATAHDQPTNTRLKVA